MAINLVQGKQINVNLTGSFTGSFTGILTGTSSWSANSVTSSFVTGSNVFGPFGSNSIISASQATSASYALTASFALNAGGGGGSTFPFSGSAVITGSLLISSSLTVTGSLRVSGSITGSLFGTASFATSASNINGFSAATIQQINIGQTNDGTYAYIVRAQELEQSKHTTHNIYNNLNFI
jgi:hypothetical protein